MQPSLRNFKHIKRYEDPINKCITAKILPGEFYVTKAKEMVTTVLGSCVAACIYDPVSGYGGMNHFMLPEDRKSEGTDSSAKYGLYAMENLINEIIKCGADKSNLQCKLFGGGQIIENMSNIGQNNIRFAKKYLLSEGIPIESSDLGLVYPRKVNFFPCNGKAMVKRLKCLHNNTIEDREKQYLASIKKEDITGDIELF